MKPFYRCARCQGLHIKPGVVARAVLWGLFFATLWGITGCATGPNRLAHYPEADVLFTTPADVDRLCRRAPNAPPARIILGCYFPKMHLAIVPHGDPAVLAHELRHAREGQFHSEE